MWELRDYWDCYYNIKTCIDPPDDACETRPPTTYGYSYFSGLTPGQTYTATVSTYDILEGVTTNDTESATTCKYITNHYLRHNNYCVIF